MDLKELAIEAIYETGFVCDWEGDYLLHFLEQAEFEGWLSENTFYFASYKLQYYFKQLRDGSLSFLAVTKRVE